MPFKSEAQRRFMHARHPDIAMRWERGKHSRRKKMKKAMHSMPGGKMMKGKHHPSQ